MVQCDACITNPKIFLILIYGCGRPKINSLLFKNCLQSMEQYSFGPTTITIFVMLWNEICIRILETYFNLKSVFNRKVKMCFILILKNIFNPFNT